MLKPGMPAISIVLMPFSVSSSFFPAPMAGHRRPMAMWGKIDEVGFPGSGRGRGDSQQGAGRHGAAQHLCHQHGECHGARYAGGERVAIEQRVQSAAPPRRLHAWGVRDIRQVRPRGKKGGNIGWPDRILVSPAASRLGAVLGTSARHAPPGRASLRVRQG